MENELEEFENELVALERRVSQWTDSRSATGNVRPVAFYGSSSIRLWTTLAEDFPGVPVLNLGFGGSTLAQCAHSYRRIVVPAQPRALVFYAGDNDIAQGVSPEDVWCDFRGLYAQVVETLGDIPTTYISIKASPARWHLAENIRAANLLIRAQIEEDRRAQFIDIFPKMLNGKGEPRTELFTDDCLHMNHEGYKIWATELRGASGILTANTHDTRVLQMA